VFLAVQTLTALFSLTVPNTYCFHSIDNLLRGIIILVLRVLRIPQNGVVCVVARLLVDHLLFLSKQKPNLSKIRVLMKEHLATRRVKRQRHVNPQKRIVLGFPVRFVVKVSKDPAT